MGLKRQQKSREHRTERHYERLRILCDAVVFAGAGMALTATGAGAILGIPGKAVEAAITVSTVIMLLALAGDRRCERAYKKALRDRIRKESGR